MPTADSLPIQFQRAFYIKLGAAGKYAESAIEEGFLRFGWDGTPLEEIRAGEWDRIRQRLTDEHATKGAVTADTNRLFTLATSTSDDVWITFHQSRLWWGRLGGSGVEEDAVSKFRRLAGPWRDTSVKGSLLLANQIPGQISQLQGFRGTVCSVGKPEALRRLLNGESSPTHDAMRHASDALVAALIPAIQQLHWKDFETLVDLLFRQAGWRRRSVLGETMKFADLELEEPVTGDLYQVQVKSKADVSDLEAYSSAFSLHRFRKLYFVVHSPSPALAERTSTEAVEVILPARLARMVLEHGLISWLADRVQ